MHEVGLSARSTSPTQIRMARTPDAEIALIERVCSGETQLFYELISPYERRVYVAAVSVLQNEADAEEAAQEAFLKAFVHLHSFRGDAKFSTWLIQIAANEARRKRRKDHKFLYDPSTRKRRVRKATIIRRISQIGAMLHLKPCRGPSFARPCGMRLRL